MAETEVDPNNRAIVFRGKPQREKTMGVRLCSLEGCDRPLLAKGFCKRHYYRNYRGLPMDGPLIDFERKFKALPVETLAYAAGFIDADGSIMLECKKLTLVTPRITATGIDRKPIDFLAEAFGGTPHLVKRIKSAPAHYHPVWVWQVTGNRAIAIARAIMPFLKIKGVQAYLLSCFDYEATWVKGGSDVAIPEGEKVRRLGLLDEMRHFNSHAHLAN